VSTFSPSRLSTYEQCPRRYRFRYVDKIDREEVKTIEAFTGGLVHDALEKLYKDLRLGSLMAKDALLAYFDSLWKKEWSKDIKIVREAMNSDQFKDLGHRCLIQYYDRYAPFDQGETLGLEAKVFFPLDKEGRYTIEGYIDRLVRSRDGALEIHDYKTGSGNLPSRSELRSDRQLALYSIGAQKEWGDGNPVRSIWHFLAFNEEITIELTEEELKEARRSTLELIHEIESETEFPTTYKFALCAWCEYEDICPATKHSRRLDSLTPIEAWTDKGRGLVDEYMRLKEEIDSLEKSTEKERVRIEAELSRLKDALGEYARKQGLDVLTGKNYRIRVRWYPSVEFPDWKVREEVEGLLNDAGKLMDVAGVDSRRLARAIMNRTLPEDLIKKIKSLVSVGERPYLYPSKK